MFSFILVFDSHLWRRRRYTHRIVSTVSKKMCVCVFFSFNFSSIFPLAIFHFRFHFINFVRCTLFQFLYFRRYVVTSLRVRIARSNSNIESEWMKIKGQEKQREKFAGSATTPPITIQITLFCCVRTHITNLPEDRIMK